ncbi:MAG: FAD-dependent oxidoreductase [Holophagales bacterium]|nr:FAD-dependent oxidoreductase [Holophagales bacterium]
MSERRGPARGLCLEIDGRETLVAPGTSVAAAVWNRERGVVGLRRSVTGQGRGPLCGMGICFECRVELDGQVQARSCNVPCRDGMSVRTAEGSRADPSGCRPGREELAISRFEVAVIGGGPAGVAAAVTAAEAGAEVVLVDDNPELGGQIWRQGSAGYPAPASPTPASPAAESPGTAPPAARPWLQRLEAAGVELLCPATVVDAQRDGQGSSFSLLLETPRGPRRVEAPRLILATGAVERFLPFPGWTLPGVVGAGGLQALIKGGLDVEGRRVVVAGSGPLLPAVAELARHQGAKVVALVEQVPAARARALASGLWAHPGKALQAAKLGWSLGFGLPGFGVPVLFGSWPVRAEGSDALERVVLGGDRGARSLECELLACAFGLVPSVELARYRGCELEAESSSVAHDRGGSAGKIQVSALGGVRVRVDEYQRTSLPGVWAAGELTGVGGVGLALVEGRIAGASAADRPERSRSCFGSRRREGRVARRLEQAVAVRPALRRLADEGTVVCRCEDVTWGFVRRQLVRSADQRQAEVDLLGLKLETRCGMGPCQGRVCGPPLEFLTRDLSPSHAGENRGFTGLHGRGRPPLFPTHLETLMNLGATEEERR